MSDRCPLGYLFIILYKNEDSRAKSFSYIPLPISVFLCKYMKDIVLIVLKLLHKNESTQTELGAHAILVMLCTGSHIIVVTYFHNNSLLACIETNRIKTSKI